MGADVGACISLSFKTQGQIFAIDENHHPGAFSC
jgi:hypothetical protein